jgi:lipid II isoglutaminyl synthase (glutamine-hydrolysing)
MNYTLDAKRYKLTIGWLYPDLMSTYGDRGNIIVLQKRCEWRGIEIGIRRLNPGFNNERLATCDILFMGGAQDTQQSIVSKDFSKEKISTLKEMVENNTPGLFICGAYQFLGKYYKEANGNKIPGLDMLDLYTEHPGKDYPRLIGNILIESRIANRESLFVGFENHGGRTYLGDSVKPLGKVIKGFGNNGEDDTEGAVYKNTFASYLHGPILPKNPILADLLIHLALEKKYKKTFNLQNLDDSLEKKAKEAIVTRMNIEI